jgi:hypothetical protein
LADRVARVVFVHRIVVYELTLDKVGLPAHIANRPFERVKVIHTNTIERGIETFEIYLVCLHYRISQLFGVHASHAALETLLDELIEVRYMLEIENV